MIAKITRGERVGDIAAYLHGPGKANEHHYIQDKRRHIGGMVIASNIGAEGATDPAEWAADLRLARQQRPEITKPIWQASLRAAPGDRVMGDREWADIASRFMEEMGVGDHPWVAVRHGKDHVHVVVSRVSDTGEVWHGRNDRRTAQKVCTGIEQRHGLEQAPRRKAQPKKAVTVQRQQWREAEHEARTITPEQRRRRRAVQQLTRQEWDALDPEVQQVLRTTQPHRVPGATVPKTPSPTSTRPRTPVTRPRTTQRQRGREAGPER